eukprot:EW705510.1.p2 GENE.EW705510.1~~EW705510.1.p2  ORF type:complete len:194 (-),score=32.79 EW705510.1:3-584(-)
MSTEHSRTCDGWISGKNSLTVQTGRTDGRTGTGLNTHGHSHTRTRTHARQQNGRRRCLSHAQQTAHRGSSSSPRRRTSARGGGGTQLRLHLGQLRTQRGPQRVGFVGRADRDLAFVVGLATKHQGRARRRRRRIERPQRAQQRVGLLVGLEPNAVAGRAQPLLEFGQGHAAFATAAVHAAQQADELQQLLPRP